MAQTQLTADSQRMKKEEWSMKILDARCWIKGVGLLLMGFIIKCKMKNEKEKKR